MTGCELHILGMIASCCFVSTLFLGYLLWLAVTDRMARDDRDGGCDDGTCETCRWWGVRDTLFSGRDGHYCHKHWPARAGGPQQIDWPITSSYDWCGDYSPRSDDAEEGGK